MKSQEESLSELRYKILDGMADDYEDVEQLYLFVNRQFEKEAQANIEFPLMLVAVRFPLWKVINEILDMLEEGYIFAMYSNDYQIAPLSPLNLSAIHHYWFGVTDKGTKAWKTNSVDS